MIRKENIKLKYYKLYFLEIYFQIKLKKFCKLFLLINLTLFLLSYNIIKINKINIINKKYYIPIDHINKIYFKMINLTYLLSIKYNIIEIKYYINFYDDEYKLINPFELALFNDIHIVCNIISKVNETNINFLSKFFRNKHIYCIQYINIHENLQFGIKIYIKNKKYKDIIFFNKDNIVDYNNLKCYSDNHLNPSLINKKYLVLIKDIIIGEKNQNLSDNLNFKKFYLDKPIFTTLFNLSLKEDIWEYKNIYNNYFCFCKGSNCFYNNKCKYSFYLNIIDENKNLYKKTDYLLADFFSADTSSDDAYPIFEEMIKQNISAHYMDVKYSLYNRFCKQENHCLKIIPAIIIDGEFLEK